MKPVFVCHPQRLFAAALPAAIAIVLTTLSTTAMADHHEKKEGEHGHAHAEGAKDFAPDFGVAILRPTKGSKVRGQLRLVETGDRLRIMGRVSNLTPGKHGFHIHEFGDARSTDGKSSGGHYNPDGHEHGGPGETSHAGDLGNITAGDNGVAEVDVEVEGTALHFLFGRAFVVHAGEDDLKSQPSGDAGGRVAVGVIGIGNKEWTRAKQ